MTDLDRYLDPWHPDTPLPRPPAGLKLRAEQMRTDTWLRLGPVLNPDSRQDRTAVELLCRLRQEVAEQTDVDTAKPLDRGTVAALLAALSALGL